MDVGQIRNKRLFISGGEGGLARALAFCFSDAGWLVDAPARAELDVSDTSAVESWFANRESYDLVVCAAGVTRDQLLLRQTEEVWDTVMQVNTRGAAWCARSAAEQMIDSSRKGQVVMIGSYAAVHPAVSQSVYACSKSALEGLVKSLAREWGRFGIRVNLVLPGFMLTKMTQGLRPEVSERALRKHVLGQFNTPEQVAAFLLFLQETMTATSGQVFDLDSRIL